MLHIRNLFNKNKINIKSLLGSRNHFTIGNKNNEQRTEKIFIDEQSIKRKMKQLKQQGQNNTEQQKKKKKNLDFMPTFTIPEVNKKVQDYRKQTQTENLFAFSEITLEEKPTVLQITAYDPEFFEIDNFAYPPSIILTPNQVLNWQVQDSQSIRIEDFSILKIIRPQPQYIIIGVPDITVIKPELRNKIRQIHKNVDILNLFEAISQYNTVANADKYFMAFLMTN